MNEDMRIVVTEELDAVAVRELFHRFLGFCRESGVESLEVEFGFAWNNEMTGGPDRELTLVELPSVLATKAIFTYPIRRDIPRPPACSHS